jgi:hypothetical protein
MARRWPGSSSTIRLRADWRAELDSMGARIRSLRARLAAFDPRLAYIGEQKGMFSLLPLTRRRCSSFARATASTWRRPAGSTSSACRTTMSMSSPPRSWRRSGG